MKGKENNRRRSATKREKVEIRRSEASTTSQKLRREISKKRIKMRLAMKRERVLQVGEGPSMEHNVPTTLNLFPDPLELTLAPPPQPVELSKGKEIATTSKESEKRGNEVEAVNDKKKIKNMVGGEGDQCELSLKL